MRAAAVALLVEEQRSEILAGWRRDVDRELGGEPALAFAAGPLLREMALALREEPSPLLPGAQAVEPGARSAVLVRSGAAPARVAREFKLLHRALWQALKLAGAIVGADERRAGDEWLDEALAAALDRADRVRTRDDLIEPAPRHAATPDVAQPGGGARPPPFPRRDPAPATARAAPPVIAARPPPLPRSVPPAPVPVLESGFSTID